MEKETVREKRVKKVRDRREMKKYWSIMWGEKRERDGEQGIHMPAKPKKKRILNQRIVMERMMKQSLTKNCQTQILIWSKRRTGEKTNGQTMVAR